MLSEELHHRVQNTLAVVLALARLTARSVKTIDEFQVAFGLRIQAMARTNALLLRGHQQALDVRSAIEVELEPYRAVGQLTIACDPLNISAGVALSLSLLIHELATNAAKYGALSLPDGRLLVSCKPSQVGGVLIWREICPSLLARQEIAGGGSLLMKHLARDLGGEARIEMLESGIEATITFRLGDSPDRLIEGYA
ncbi:MAG: sensor histidine kinase [Caulobacteraceae bacterium]